MSRLDYLRRELAAIARLGSALAVLDWDEQVNLPPRAHGFRGEVKAMLSAEVHSRFTAPQLIKTVSQLAEPDQLKTLDTDDQVIIRETWRDIDRARKIPTEFVERFTKLTTEAFAAWVEARKSSDFSKFQPYLEKIIKMKHQEAELLGYQYSPYDALIDGFEPSMTSDRLSELFTPLAEHLSHLLASNKGIPQPTLPKTEYPLKAQAKLNEEVALALGYDLKAGRIDESPHPFTTTFHPTDVRITTRYRQEDFWVSLGSTIHEVGHGLYEQGLPAEAFGTPLGEAVSLGIHESQSRIWENFVGRSQAFSEFLHPLLKKHFGADSIKYSPDELHAWLNRVQPSPIRVEADEVTYNLHIIARFELEKALMESRLKVAELPEAWNQKMNDYLGIKITSDAQGVLQDIHWSHGMLGYFPTYSLGNLYAAQLYRRAVELMPELEKNFALGRFDKFLGWLRREIHIRGRRYKPEELIERATKEPLHPEYLQEHLSKKVKASFRL